MRIFGLLQISDNLPRVTLTIETLETEKTEKLIQTLKSYLYSGKPLNGKEIHKRLSGKFYVRDWNLMKQVYGFSGIQSTLLSCGKIKLDGKIVKRSFCIEEE